MSVDADSTRHTAFSDTAKNAKTIINNPGGREAGVMEATMEQETRATLAVIMKKLNEGRNEVHKSGTPSYKEGAYAAFDYALRVVAEQDKVSA